MGGLAGSKIGRLEDWKTGRRMDQLGLTWAGKTHNYKEKERERENPAKSGLCQVKTED